MKVLIYGGGAIGCHLAYCLYGVKNQISIVARGDHLSKIKKDMILRKIKKKQKEKKQTT